MATIDELEARAANVKALEAQGLSALGDAMRELAVSLPDQSKLAVDFAACAQRLDLFAGSSHPGIWGGAAMRQFIREQLAQRREA